MGSFIKICHNIPTNISMLMHFTGLTNISAHVVQKFQTNTKINTKINGQSHQNCYSVLGFLICLLYCIAIQLLF